jgi:curli biogenesis system outer membrane secretion channel CsgG
MSHIARPAHVARIAATVVGLIVPLAAAAQSQSAPTIAVVTFNNRAPRTVAATYDGLGEGIADLLSIAMARNAGVRVAPRDQVATLLVPAGPPGGMVDRATATTVASSAGAQHVVMGAFTVDLSGNVRIDTRVLDARTGEVEDTERMQGRGDEVVPLIERLAARLTAGMGLARVPGDVPSPAGLRLPLQSLAQYGRALQLADRRQGARAVELLDALLREHPDFQPARDRRAKLAPGG